MLSFRSSLNLAAAAMAACLSAAGCSNIKAPNRAATTGSADGTVALTQTHDSISDRADAGRIAGNPQAKVWVVMASDFQCPYCKSWHDTQFATVMKNYVATGKVRLAFLNVPLSIHPNALPAAEAAMCSAVQDKFWPMHEALFASQAKWEVMKDPTPMYDSIATSLGVSMAPWRQCVSQHLTRALIQADHDRATRGGVGSTPSFFVGTLSLSGADANVMGAIEKELAKPGK